MVNQTNNNVARSNDKSNKKENVLLSFSSESLASGKSSAKENPLNDDLIVSLAEAYENKRAQQVTEWERLRRQNVQHAA